MYLYTNAPCTQGTFWEAFGVPEEILISSFRLQIAAKTLLVASQQTNIAVVLV